MPKGKGKRKAQPPVPPSSEQQAQAEGLVLRVADNKTDYAGVHLHTTGKPYEAKGRRQASELGHLCHRRGGGAVRRAVAGGAGGGAEGCSGATPDKRGGAAAGAGRGADAGRGREHDGLLRRAPQQSSQALPGAGEARWQDGEPGLLRHRRGGGAVRRAVAGGAGEGKEGGGERERNSRSLVGAC
eukprot:scaffold232_cov67-Phaeocystis_antarctica.AAC.2